MNTRQQYQEAYRLQHACAKMAGKPHWMGAQEKDLVRWYFVQIDAAKITSDVEVKAMKSWLNKNPQPSYWANVQIKIALS